MVETVDNIIDTAQKNRDLKTLVKAIKTAGLTDTLKGSGPYTVFAPNEAAFNSLPPGRLDSLLEDKQELTKILKNHVVEGKMSKSQLLGKGTVETLQGKRVQIEEDGGLHFGKATVLKNDIECENGYCHVIDTIVMP